MQNRFTQSMGCWSYSIYITNVKDLTNYYIIIDGGILVFSSISLESKLDMDDKLEVAWSNSWKPFKGVQQDS